MIDIHKLHKKYSETLERDRLYEVFSADRTQRELRDLRVRVSDRKTEVDEFKPVNDQGENENGFTLNQLKGWLVDLEATLVKCQPIIDIIGESWKGYILVKKIPRSKEDEELWVADDLEDWFMREPVGYFADDGDAFAAEAFYNAIAMYEAEMRHVA